MEQQLRTGRTGAGTDPDSDAGRAGVLVAPPAVHARPAAPDAPIDRAGSADTGRAPDPLTGFVFLWISYLLLHHAMLYWHWFQFKHTSRLAWGTGTLILLVFALLRPSSLWRFTLLLSVLLVKAWRSLPHQSNHDFLTACIQLTMFVTIAWHALATRGRVFSAPIGAPPRDALFRHIAALAGLELLVMYFFVVLHKLNFDYLNPAVSCGVIMYREIAERFPIFPTAAWTGPLTIAGSLTAEASIPLLLAFRRTRLVGIGLGLVFHAMLAIHENPFVYGFSAMLYALYFLFLPDDVRAAMIAHWQRSVPGRAAAALGTWRGMAATAGVVALVAGTVAALVVTKTADREGLIRGLHRVAPVTVRAAFWVIALGCTYFFAMAVYRVRMAPAARAARRPATAGRASRPPSMFRPAAGPLLVLPLLVFANGFSPYLGLKTESSFAMFANLHTEGGRNNHLFMPVVHLRPYQDSIEVLETNDPRVAALSSEPAFGATYFVFRQRVSGSKVPDLRVTYRRNGGDPVTVTRATHAETELFRPPSSLERRFLHFRPVQLAGPQECIH